MLSTTVVVLPRAFRASTTALKAAARAAMCCVCLLWAGLALQYACREHVWRCGTLAALR